MLLVVGALVVVALLVTVVVLVARPGSDAPSATGHIARPVSLLQVTDEYPAPCRTGDVPAPRPATDRCLTLGPGMTITEVARIEVASGGSGDSVIRINLRPDDGRTFTDLTTRVSRESDPRNRLAIVVDGTVVSAPTVMTPIVGPALEISGMFTRQEARRLFDGIRG
ncbi:hypothetical protein Lfu02_05610 [Longispora fulva]|nr:hypothetical protein Lfu02_05610 [Longispora fulva]